MNENKYLFECKKMWNWLSYTGETFRYRYFVLMEIPIMERPLNSCFMCQYVKQKLGVDNFGLADCEEHCLLQWTGGSCCAPNSEFSKWTEACTESGKRYWADEIVKLCDEAFSGYYLSLKSS